MAASVGALLESLNLPNLQQLWASEEIGITTIDELVEVRDPHESLATTS